MKGEQSGYENGRAMTLTSGNEELRAARALTNNLLRNARVLASRNDILSNLKKNLILVEVGVALGDFTQVILQQCDVKELYAVDLFDLEKFPNMWGGRVGSVLSGKTHLEYFKERFANQLDEKRLNICVGDSVDCINRLQSESVDVFYVDANHSYENVSAEINAIRPKLKPDGIIIFNDYLMYDWVAKQRYGVVQAVNEFMLTDNWEMIFFAMHPGMYCDVAITKIR